jgi:hypothetical protein
VEYERGEMERERERKRESGERERGQRCIQRKRDGRGGRRWWRYAEKVGSGAGMGMGGEAGAGGGDGWVGRAREKAWKQFDPTAM